MRGSLKNTVVKHLGYYHVTSNGTQAVYPLNLDDAAATGQKYTWAKFVVLGTKTGGLHPGNLKFTPYTGTSVSCATGMADYPISVVGTDSGHGYTADAGTVETGRIVIEYDIDLTNSLVRTWIGGLITTVVATTDVMDIMVCVVLGGAREAPVTSTAQATTL